MLALDPKRLSTTYVEIGSDTPGAELRNLRAVYPTMLLSEDGTRLWLSRMKHDDPHIGSPYEAAYAKWITGDGRDALRVIVIFATSGDEEIIENTLAGDVTP